MPINSRLCRTPPSVRGKTRFGTQHQEALSPIVNLPIWIGSSPRYQSVFSAGVSLLACQGTRTIYITQFPIFGPHRRLCMRRLCVPRRFVGMAVLEGRAAISSYSSQSWARRKLSLCDCSAAHRLNWRLVLRVEKCQAPAPCRRLHYLGGTPRVGGYFLRLKVKTIAWASCSPCCHVVFPSGLAIRHTTNWTLPNARKPVFRADACMRRLVNIFNLKREGSHVPGTHKKQMMYI